ncbi:MAG TPA: TolC family protein [Candidatus Limnocylindrales bacterium]|nr:TolC family protein [Candidatus Limnocylindrales bacterium]
MKTTKLIFLLILACFIAGSKAPAQNTTIATNAPGWITRPLSLVDCLNLTLSQNATILKAKSDLQANYGIVIQTRAVALPHVIASGQYKRTERSAIENLQLPGSPLQLELPDQNWNAGIQIVQSIYEGGKMVAAIRAARLTKEQSLLQYQTVVQDTLLNTRVAYYDVLLAAQQIVVHEASVELLSKELEDQQSRYNAGTVPHFNVLRAEVAVANERPVLIQARNNYRIAKNNLANLLGYNLPRDIWEDIPLNLAGKLEAEPYQIDLPQAIEQALANRTELAALRKAEALQHENVVSARSGYKPTVQVFAGYNWYNAQYTPPVDLEHDIHGWNAGAELSWDIFDGMLTRGKVVQARALYEKSRTDVEDRGRQIELEVRTAYSQFIEAREVLDSQKTVQAEAEEALREAEARATAGTGTQLDVLDAQTSLTQARTTEIQALHDYDAARARLERAIGADMGQTQNPES